MKTRMFVVVAVVVFLASGCAGYRHATLKVEKDGAIVHEDTNVSFIQRSIDPLELAESYRIRKQADLLDKMMTGLQEEGKAVAANNGKFLIGIINNDSFLAVYSYHPEIPGMKLTVDPGGGFQIFSVRDIPYEIAIYNMRGGLIKKINPRYEADYQEKLAHKKLVGNILVDFLIKINRVYGYNYSTGY